MFSCKTGSESQEKAARTFQMPTSNRHSEECSYPSSQRHSLEALEDGQE